MTDSVRTIENFARAVLLGDRLEDKLVSLPPDARDEPHSALGEIPRFPGRPARLARIGKAEFPKLELLNRSATARGQVLHFFANHELLAMELMALVLLKFPEAPPAFRMGLARTIAEEQNHMRLYLDRMRELGVNFGDLPLSDYFWNAMKDVPTPLAFVTQMSLTLEQANLDFSLFYKDAIQRAGDEKTAAILERVYLEEIGHVKHGLQWFNRWRDPSTGDDWDAYLRLLPPPMTPRRAKGLSFAAEPRRQAGLSERFIRELEVYGGSKGRPPVFWLYNPLCDAEIVRGKPGFSPPKPVRRLGLDLEPLLMQLASDQDVAFVQELPRADWLKQMRELGFTAPEFRLLGRSGETPRETKLGGLEPWGWSPESFERFRALRDRLTPIDGANGAWAAGFLASSGFSETGLGAFFSKQWSVRFQREWLAAHPEDRQVFGQEADAGIAFTDWERAREALQASFNSRLLLAKAPWGTSGTQNKRVLEPSELDGSLGGWIRNVIETQGAVILEPWLDKIADLSIQLEISSGGVRLLGARRFYVGSRLEYRGTELDSKLCSLEAESLRFLHSEAAPLERWKTLARAVGQALAQAGYQGPAGIDALLWRDATGTLKLKPLVELNPRWTMGRVALAIESRVLPGRPARWRFVSRRELPAGQDFAAWATQMQARHPAHQVHSGGGLRISEGIIATTDPERAREILTVLVVGERACAEPTLAL